MDVFRCTEIIGDHRVYSSNDSGILDYLKRLWGVIDLEKLHLHSNDFRSLSPHQLSEIDSDKHTAFYNFIKSDESFLVNHYIPLVRKVHAAFFPSETELIYQTYPTIRIQYPDGTAIPKHRDSDPLSKHPFGENNFIIPMTRMFDTCSMYIESSPDKEDFSPMTLQHGQLLWFNGNMCTHYNEKNREGITRVSLDFRVITCKDYSKYIDGYDVEKAIRNERDIERNRDPTMMILGGYYQLMSMNHTPFRFKKSTDTIMQHRPLFTEREADACHQYMLADTFVTEHNKTREFERILEEYIGVGHCIMTTSGTSAIVMALLACDLPHGSEVIVPNYTMIATVNAVSLLGYTPVFVDVCQQTYTSTVENVEARVTSKTRAVIHVSLNNRYHQLQSLVDFCNARDIVLIEDSAQSLGVRTPDTRSLGTYGRIGCFSLSTPKIISTGQGGFCVTNDDGLATKMRMIKNFGRKESGKDDFETFGINMKYTDLQAVIGIEQMSNIHWRVDQMRHIYDVYYAELSGTNGLDMFAPLNDEWLPWFVDLYVESDTVRDALAIFLKRHKIQTRVVYDIITNAPMYTKYEANTPNAVHATSRGLFLPSYLSLQDDEIRYICQIIKLFFSTHLPE